MHQSRKIDDIVGWVFFNNSNDPRPHDRFDPGVRRDGDHGTLTAGIISAMGDNGTDVAGVAWNVSIVPLVGRTGSQTVPDVSQQEAIVYGRCCMARSAGAVRLVDRLSSGLLAGALMTIAGRVDTPADRRWCMNRYPTGWRPVGRVHHGLQHGADDVKALDGPSHLQDQVPGHQLARVRPGAGPTGGEPVLCDRDVHLERIGEAGRRRWRLEAGQHHQSRAANTFYRYSG